MNKKTVITILVLLLVCVALVGHPVWQCLMPVREEM